MVVGDTPVAVDDSRGEVLFTDGDWRIHRFTWRGGFYLSIQHFCTAGRSGSLVKGWVGIYYHYNGLWEPCRACDRVPPKGLQGLFATLTIM